MKNEKMNIKKISNVNTAMPKVQGQGCLDDCREWIGKNASSSNCRLVISAKTSNLF